MKILRENLLFNNLKDTLDVIKEVTLIKRTNNEVVIMMPLEEYNTLKAQSYKGKEANNEN